MNIHIQCFVDLSIQARRHPERGGPISAEGSVSVLSPGARSESREAYLDWPLQLTAKEAVNGGQVEVWEFTVKEYSPRIELLVGDCRVGGEG